MKYLGTAPSDPLDLVTNSYADGLTIGGGGGGTPPAVITPVQHHTLGTETFTIVGGSVTTISGTTIQSQTVSVNDRVLVINAPGGTDYTGTGESYGFSSCPANGIYVVNSIGTDMSVSRSSDFSGSVKPAGLMVFSQNALAGWLAQSVFAVRSPYAPISITYGADWIQFRTVGGANISADSVYTNYGRYGMWNAGPSSSTYLYANPAALPLYTDHDYYLPAEAGTLATEAYVLAHAGGGTPGAAQVFVQQDDPETTNPTYTGPAVWYILNSAGDVIGKKVRP